MMIDNYFISLHFFEVCLFRFSLNIHFSGIFTVIAASGVEDVRDVLDHYNQESDPIEAFLIRQQKLFV